MATAASVLPTLVRESVPGYSVRDWSPQQLDAIAERIPHIHRQVPTDAAFTGPTCLFDGRTWPCPAERWRRRHNRVTHASTKRIACRRLAGLCACLVLGLLLVTDSSAQVTTQPRDGVHAVNVGQRPASLRDERVLVDKARSQAQLRNDRAELPIRRNTEYPATARSTVAVRKNVR